MAGASNPQVQKNEIRTIAAAIKIGPENTLNVETRLWSLDAESARVLVPHSSRGRPRPVTNGQGARSGWWSTSRPIA